jgi:integrase
MSSISKRPNGHRWICYKFRDKRHTIRLGAASERDARIFQLFLDRLIDARRFGQPIEPEIVAWLGRIDRKLHRGLLTAGLVEERGPSTVGELVAAHERRLIAREREESTLVNARVLYGNLKRHFGEACQISSITLDAADAFRTWLLTFGKKDGTGLMPSTVTNRCRRARAVFAYAIKNGWLVANPFRELGQGSEANAARNVYISRELFERILNATKDVEFRMLLAMARYAGLRSPSEVTKLQWSTIDLEIDVFTAKAPKTKRHEGREQREIPIFPELKARILEAKAHAVGPMMFPRHQITAAAITSKFTRVLRTIDESLWAKPFVNLRASCEHDWLSTYKIHEVAAWMGHSPETMLKHYNRVVKEQQVRAATALLRVVPGSSKRSKSRSSTDVHKRQA